MLRPVAVLALMGCLLPLAASSAGAAAVWRGPEANKFILRLGDPRFPIRTHALLSLEKMGPSILPQLRLALPQAKDPEVKRQLEALIPKLEQQIALAPTRFSLDLKEVSLTKAAAEVSRLSGYKVEIYRSGANDPEQMLVTIQAKNITFWEAVGKLCEAGGYTLQEHYSPEGRTIRLMAGDHYPGSLCLSGAFRVMIRNMYHYRTLDFTTGRNGTTPELRRSATLQVNLSICAEPKMPLLGAGYPTITEAVDDLGQSLRMPPINRNQMHYHGYRSYMHNVQAQLETSANGRRLRSFKGTIPITVVSAQRPLITVENLATVKNQTFKQGTTTIHIESVSYTGNQTNIKMNVTESARTNNPDYAWSQTVLQRFEVTDEKGNKLQSYGGNWSGGMNTLNGTFTFGSNGNDGKAVKLVLHDWTTVTYNVPFEFEELPLP